MRKRAKRKADYSAEAKAEAVRLYAEGTSPRTLQKRYGCSTGMFYTWLKEAGVPTRIRHRPKAAPPQPFALEECRQQIEVLCTLLRDDQTDYRRELAYNIARGLLDAIGGTK